MLCCYCVVFRVVIALCSLLCCVTVLLVVVCCCVIVCYNVCIVLYYCFVTCLVIVLLCCIHMLFVLVCYYCDIYKLFLDTLTQYISVDSKDEAAFSFPVPRTKPSAAFPAVFKRGQSSATESWWCWTSKSGDGWAGW